MTATLHRLWHAQTGRCWYCNAPTWLKALGESRAVAAIRLLVPTGQPGSKKAMLHRLATIEHLKRRADGGQIKDGVVMACAFCNTCREATPPAEHRQQMRALVTAGTHPSHVFVADRKTRRAALKEIRTSTKERRADRMLSPAPQLRGELAA